MKRTLNKNFIKNLLTAIPLSLITAVNPNYTYAENQTSTHLTSDKVNILVPNKLFNPKEYSSSAPKNLEYAIEASKEKRGQESKQLKLDLKEIIGLSNRNSNSGNDNIATHDHGLSLGETRAKALKNNLSIEIAMIEPMIAATSLREEQAKFDNIIFAYAKQTNIDTPKAAGDYVSLSANSSLNGEKAKLSVMEQNIRSLDIAAGIKIPLRTGGMITLTSPLENKRNSGEFKTNEYFSALRFSFSQPLLRNAGRNINEASIRVAEFDKQAINARTKLQAIRIITSTDKAYWALYEAWAQLDIRNQQYELALKNLNIVKRRVEEGLTAAIELTRAEIGVADRSEALIVAKTNLKLAQRQLKFFMNEIDDESSPENIINPLTEPYLLRYEFDRPKLLNDAFDGRLELLELETKLAADLVNIEYLENQTLPLFTLDYQYGALSPNANSFGSSLQNTINNQFSDWSVGLRFEMPFTNEVNKAKLENAIQQKNKRLATKKLQMLSIKKEIYDALDQVENNWQRIIAARQQVVIAGANYDAEIKQFNEGLRTMTEVLETLSRLGEAQIKEVKAISDYQISMIDTAYATGTVLGYSGLDWK